MFGHVQFIWSLVTRRTTQFSANVVIDHHIFINECNHCKQILKPKESGESSKSLNACVRCKNIVVAVDFLLRGNSKLIINLDTVLMTQIFYVHAARLSPSQES